MNEIIKDQSQEIFDFIYRDTPFRLTLCISNSSLKVSLEAVFHSIIFKNEILDDKLSFNKIPLLFLKLLIKMALGNHAKAPNKAKISEKFRFKLYCSSNLKLFEQFPKFTKEEFEKLKQENEEKIEENILKADCIILRIKIQDFKPGINFDIKLQLPKILNKPNPKYEFKKKYLEEQIIKKWQDLISEKKK